jgi:hypothetical protein
MVMMGRFENPVVLMNAEKHCELRQSSYCGVEPTQTVSVSFFQ